MKKRSSRIIPHRFDEETEDGIDKEKEPEDLTVECLLIFFPPQKEKEAQTTSRFVQLRGVERNIQSGQRIGVFEENSPGEECLLAVATSGQKTAYSAEEEPQSNGRREEIRPFPERQLMPLHVAQRNANGKKKSPIKNQPSFPELKHLEKVSAIGIKVD